MWLRQYIFYGAIVYNQNMGSTLTKILGDTPATAALQAQLAAQGVTIPGATTGALTVDEAIKKYWMYGAVGVIALILLLRK